MGTHMHTHAPLSNHPTAGRRKKPGKKKRGEEGCALTFILSIEASILNCWTVRRAWAMLLVVLAVLPDIFGEALF